MFFFEDFFLIRIINKINFLIIKDKDILIKNLIEFDMRLSHTLIKANKKKIILNYKNTETYVKIKSINMSYIIDYYNYKSLIDINKNIDTKLEKKLENKLLIKKEISKKIKIPDNLEFRIYTFD